MATKSVRYPALAFDEDAAIDRKVWVNDILYSNDKLCRRSIRPRFQSSQSSDTSQEEEKEVQKVITLPLVSLPYSWEKMLAREEIRIKIRNLRRKLAIAIAEGNKVLCIEIEEQINNCYERKKAM